MDGIGPGFPHKRPYASIATTAEQCNRLFHAYSQIGISSSIRVTLAAGLEKTIASELDAAPRNDRTLASTYSLLMHPQ